MRVDTLEIGDLAFGVDVENEVFGSNKHKVWRCPEIPELYVKGIAATRNFKSVDDVLVTLEIRMHRWVLAEFNTHRVMSRNSASSRAIPVRKRLQDVRQKAAYPVIWAAEKPGMQGGSQIENIGAAQDLWNSAADYMAKTAEGLASLNVHKSITNRLLEPFLYHTAIVTGTEWDGFIAQRESKLAQPEIHVIGFLVACAIGHYCSHGVPALSAPGAWHLPYIDVEQDTTALIAARPPEDFGKDMNVMQELAKVSAARCARVSYLTHDGVRDIMKDIELYDRLKTADPLHASPLEHVAMVVSREQRAAWPGNLIGFAQLRHFVEMGINPF